MAAGDEKRTPRILYLLSHPIQYQVPLLQFLASREQVHVHTLFAQDTSRDPYFDEGFQQQVRWDIPLLEGYSHEFLPRRPVLSGKTIGSSWNRGLRTALCTRRPDVVWTHGYDSPNAVRLIAQAKRRGIPVIVRAEVEDSDAVGGPAVRRAKDSALRLGYRAIDGFLTIGRKNADFYRDRGVPDTKLHSAPYAVDNDAFAKAVAQSRGGPSLEVQYSLPPGPVFVWSGKLLARKRPLDAIHALAALHARGTHASLVIFGSGELELECHGLVEQYGLGSVVRFPGFVNQTEIRLAYGRATALLLTSERERWGLVANEAMASGCPVIAAATVGCADDLVLEDESGLVVPCGDVPSLAQAMAVLCSQTKRSRLAQGARARVAEFSFAAVEAGILSAVDAVTSSGRGR